MTPQAFDYAGSYWTTEAGRFRETVPRWAWGLELLVGPQGWLTVTPALAFGLLGIALIACRRSDPLRPAAWTAGAVTAVLIAYYTWGVRRTDFAGLSFGTRHLLAVSPIVFFFAVAGLDRLRNRWANVAFALVLVVGIVYAWAGMIDPWSRIERRPDVALRVLQRGVLYPWSSYNR
jgi:hypothetical protein